MLSLLMMMVRTDCVYIYMFTICVCIFLNESCLLSIICLCSPVLTIEFVEKMFPIPEDNGTVTVCLNTSIDTAEELVVEVTASVMTDSNSGAASKTSKSIFYSSLLNILSYSSLL